MRPFLILVTTTIMTGHVGTSVLRYQLFVHQFHKKVHMISLSVTHIIMIIYFFYLFFCYFGNTSSRTLLVQPRLWPIISQPSFINPFYIATMHQNVDNFSFHHWRPNQHKYHCQALTFTFDLWSFEGYCYHLNSSDYGIYA